MLSSNDQVSSSYRVQKHHTVLPLPSLASKGGWLPVLAALSAAQLDTTACTPLPPLLTCIQVGGGLV